MGIYEIFLFVLWIKNSDLTLTKKLIDTILSARPAGWVGVHTSIL